MLASTGILLWQVVLYPAATLLIGLAGYLPFWIKREQNRKAHEKRVEATCDVVLGLPADPNIGRSERIPGLREQVQKIQNGIGEMNGKTIMGHIQDIEQEIREIKR